MAVVPWTDLAMDFLTELPTLLGKSTVLVVVDRFSKMLRLIPLGEQTDTESVACAFFNHMVHICMVYHELLYQISIQGLWDKSGLV